MSSLQRVDELNILTRAKYPILYIVSWEERRIEDMLRQVAIDSNPLTHLPGNNTIMEVIQDAIDCGLDMGLIYTDLDNFKSYNDAYGFSAGDDVLRFCAEVLQEALQEVSGGDGFLGHIGGDDFVVMVPLAQMEKVGEGVARKFDTGAPQFYSEKDRQNGGITAPDRKGQEQFFPIVAISMGGLALQLVRQ